MGQRHVYFIIAKINGRYHTMAAVCLRWGFGREPSRVCWRLLQILGHPLNKKLVAHELNYAATFTESLWDDLVIVEDEEIDITKRIPFPFTATCLVLAAGFDPRPRTSYYQRLSVLSSGINLTVANNYNDDGFTIVNITNLDDIHLCFLFPFLLSWQEESEEDPENESSQIIKPPGFTPLTAEEYTACYDKTPDGNHDLSCWGLINADTLRDLWPDGNWCDRNDGGPGGTHIKQEARIASLKELAFLKAIGNDLENAELGMVEQLMPDFLVRLRKWLHEFPESAKTLGLRILGRLMKGAQCLDLSAFHWLPEEVIIKLVKENADVDIVDSIDLSNNTTITASGIEKLLQVCPNITKLITLYTPKLSMDALVGVLAGSKVGELLHTELFQSYFNPWEMRPTYATYSEAITQIVYLSAQTSSRMCDSYRLDQKGLKWSKLAEKGLVFAECIPVRDAFLVMSRVTDWLDQLLNFFGSHSVFYSSFTEWHIHDACAQAMALELRVRDLNIGCSSY